MEKVLTIEDMNDTQELDIKKNFGSYNEPSNRSLI
jgi:hypothetical protein